MVIEHGKISTLEKCPMRQMSYWMDIFPCPVPTRVHLYSAYCPELYLVGLNLYHLGGDSKSQEQE